MGQLQMFLLSGQDQESKWFNSPVRFYEGSLKDIPQHVPDFDRQDFTLGNKSEQPNLPNARLDTIIRKPFGTERAFVPIGIVSKEYVLIKHAEVIETATEAMKSLGTDPAEVQAELTLTEYGERMALSLYLPEKYTFIPIDGNELSMRLECFNSVDGSTRFRVMMGWFRFVCSNGLVIGVTQADIRHRHVEGLNLGDVSKVLSFGLKGAEADKENFRKWQQKTIQGTALAQWVDEDLRRGWGFKAATRAFHIARTGYDVEIVGQYNGQKPTTIKTKQARRVPGSPAKSKNLFDISQVLAWLAKERHAIQEQLQWREQIPDILKPLMN
jgi:hypothetical protein